MENSRHSRHFSMAKRERKVINSLVGPGNGRLPPSNLFLSNHLCTTNKTTNTVRRVIAKAHGMLCFCVSVSLLRGGVGCRRLWEKIHTKLDGKPGSRNLTPEIPCFGQKESSRTERRNAKTVKLGVYPSCTVLLGLVFCWIEVLKASSREYDGWLSDTTLRRHSRTCWVRWLCVGGCI